MSKPKHKSLTDAFKKAAITMTSSVGVAATVGGIGGLTTGPMIAAGIAMSSAISMAGAAFGKKKSLMSGITYTAEAPAEEPEPLPGIEISVETGAPVKAMKRITFRR